jgi:hypothetical protein
MPVKPLGHSQVILIRPRAWWYNKLPLSITLLLLLLDGHTVTADAVMALVALVVAVSAVGNYGYALNELFDVEEDALLGRKNAAAAHGVPRVSLIVLGSAAVAATAALVGAGILGLVLVSCVLALPLSYSVPPVRLKERLWLGVLADAMAAHVFPVILACLIVVHLSLAKVGLALTVALACWGLATGLRGILSHQLHTADQDSRAGLVTIVHNRGRDRVELAITAFLLPCEVVAFAAAAMLCETGPLLWLVGALYLLNECIKTAHPAFRVVAFRPEGQRYLPFVEEAFYKAWGPLAIAVDAARVDLTYLVMIPLYARAFRPHLIVERGRFGALYGPLVRKVPWHRSTVPVQDPDIR